MTLQQGLAGMTRLQPNVINLSPQSWLGQASPGLERLVTAAPSPIFAPQFSAGAALTAAYWMPIRLGGWGSRFPGERVPAASGQLFFARQFGR
jgi:hypothetical protein